jgi:ribonuclease D
MPIDYTYIETIEELEFFAPVRSGDFGLENPIGFDIETTSKEPWDGKVSTIQISNGFLNLIVDALVIGNEGIKGSWIGELVHRQDVLKVAHNAKFEMKWLMFHLRLRSRRTSSIRCSQAR